MPRHRLLWKLYATYLLVIVICTLAVGVNAVQWMEPFHTRQRSRDLLQTARLIAMDGEFERLLATRPEGLDALCEAYAEPAGTWITVIDKDGVVLGDSRAGPPDAENQGDRAEVLAARRGEVGRHVRWSLAAQGDVMYVAVPLEHDGEVLGVLRTALPLTEIEDALASVTRWIVIGAITVAVLASLLALWISRRISRPLEEMRLSAARFAQGDFTRKIPVLESDEIGSLAQSLNSMADQLDQRIRTITRQQRELAAVLASMTEGVLAVDGTERIISINDAAAQMFQVSAAAKVRGRALPEVIRNPDLQNFVREVRETRDIVVDEIVLEQTGSDGQRLQLHGSLLRDADENEIGVLVMLTDVTRLRRLEQVRRDFVANVSHELKTPITSIQGFVETLREGALADPEKGARFLDIIAKQTARLNAIIDDLLSLSRLEQDADYQRVEMIEGRVRDVLQGAVTACTPKAVGTDILLQLDCPQEMKARFNPQLLEQAVSNLLDNAIKYSVPGSPVAVQAERDNGEIVIRVSDRGCGIPAEHLPRIFERFYCVDKARSRTLGGTGLGLAIVKHIAQAHGGRVTVRSTVGRGSTFMIHLPC